MLLLFWQIRLGEGVFAKPGKYTMWGLLENVAVGNQLYTFKFGIGNKTDKTLEREYKMIGQDEIKI